MTNPLNTRELTDLPVDYLGYIFYPGSKRFIGNPPDLNLFKNIPEMIMKTGVFVNENTSLILEYASRYGLDIIQLHGDESASYCRSLLKAGLNIVKLLK